MRHRAIILILSVLFLFSWVSPLFPASPASEYLCEFGISFYRSGRYNDALTEFKKVLLIDPDNKIAKKYVDTIFKKEAADLEKEISPAAPAIAKVSPSPLTRDEAMTQAFKKLSYRELLVSQSFISGKTKLPEEKESKGQAGKVKISGQVQFSFGLAPGDFIWKRANYDLNEKYKSWRLTSEAVFNRRFNTYDPRIYDSLDVNVDTENKQGFNFHTDLTVDPWSFVGKSDKITVTGSNGDTAEMQMYYWSNTGYVANDTVYTSLTGDSFGIPELKVKDGMTDPLTVTSYRAAATLLSSNPNSGNRYFTYIPENTATWKGTIINSSYSLLIFPRATAITAI